MLSASPAPKIRSLAFAIALATLFPTLASAQQLLGWGYNAAGQLEYPPAKGLVQVAAGDTNTFALKSDGSLIGWGAPALLPPPPLTGVVQIAVGGPNVCVLKSDGTVSGWISAEGSPVLLPPATLRDVVQIDCSGSHGAALKRDGTVAVWGDNRLGKLTPPSDLRNVVQVACGPGKTLALKSDGTIVIWGPSINTDLIPPEGLGNVTQIAVFNNNAAALKSDGTVVVWGSDLDGDMAPPAGLSGVVQIDVGENHIVALKSDGSIVNWGSNYFGQQNMPAGFDHATQVACGAEWTFAYRPPAWVAIDHLSIYAGGSATGTVTLSEPAGTDGETVAISASEGAVVVPTTVRVPAGARSATFPIRSSLFFGADRIAQISVQRDGVSTPSVRLMMKGQTASLSTNVSSFVGGSTSNPILTLSLGWLSSTDTRLSLASSDPSVALPASVTIPAGQSSLRVPVSHVPVPTDRSVSLDAAYKGERVASASVSVRAMTGRIEMASSRVDAGSSVAGKVRLDSVARSSMVVSLRSDYGSLVVPASVTVPAGAREASFVATAKETAGNRTVTLTGSVGGSPILGAVRTVAKAEVAAVEMSTFLVGCSRTAGRVRIKAASPEGGILVNLASSDPSVKVPSKVLVPAGSYSAEFEATSADVPSLATAIVTASVGNTATSDSIEVRPLAVSSLTMPSSTKGGTAVTATVTLTANVSVSRTVTLTVNDKSLATVPTSVLVPAGARSVSFSIVTKSTSSQKSLTISAKKNESNVVKTLKINP
ncbi:hypothetical protein EON79_07845 [bacterium]|nr:MAG: hypothetical protein EON79_07845 [bacterium]